MAAFHHGFYFLGWLLLLACSWAADAPTPTYPQIVEVDMIFPRNETYAPTQLMPFVFAIQNFRVAKPLYLHFFYTLDQIPYNKSTSAVGQRYLNYANYSSSDTYFLYDWTRKINTTEGTWELIWTWSADNCSQPKKDPESHLGSRIPLEVGSVGTRNILYFTTKHGAKQPDLVAATQDGTCGESRADTVNITEVMDVPWDDSYYKTQPSCAVLSTITPTPNPCRAKIDSVIASSISSAIQSTACIASWNPIGSCPPESTSTRRAVQFSAGGTALLAATLAWLIHMT
ncbi:hypothetical protein McanMca71_007698 [Microsporum canis]|uniref:DUF7136 domain-containing protein n=1 Tax=Arthroderma otae (strain ATCC MYA-4605 / CBS 113480) TaxID=554155 RepID=C5FNX3_ARTOC|nr:conserved hypothetical protein [Microsporum canis CBS 113480]EEQ31826.1 conserved hypothetical protein [Microsporum canis CBS 113480]